MKPVTYIILGCIIAVLGENCDKFGILLYEDLGCTPEYGEFATCPVKYSCSGLEPSNETCYFRSKSYKNGETVEEGLSSSSCHTNCSCSVRERRASFHCAPIECPESLGAPTKPGCYRRFSLDECCSNEQFCPSATVETCRIKGTEYKEGEQFFPDNTCLDCVCQKNFTGKFEQPFCKRRSCNTQLDGKAEENVQNACAPLYGKKSEHVLCCPNNWICPDGSEVIKGKAEREKILYATHPKSAYTGVARPVKWHFPDLLRDGCKFGSKTLRVGENFDKFNLENSFGRNITKVTCECVIPPLLTCHEM